MGLLADREATGVFQIVSDRPLPWQLVYCGDSSSPVDCQRFLGLRFATEHLQSTGLGVARCRPSEQSDPAVAFISPSLPSETITRHRNRFKGEPLLASERQAYFSEDAVIDEVTGMGLGRAAFYFYCHAQVNALSSEHVYLKLTDHDSRLTLDALRRTTMFKHDAGRRERLEFTNAPLVFLNACGSAQVEGRYYERLLGYFVDKRAGCVIGTETEMPAFFATEFAMAFWNEVLDNSAPIGQALFEVRRHFWEEYGNPLGLLYSLYLLYSSAEFTVAAAPGRHTQATT